MLGFLLGACTVRKSKKIAILKRLRSSSGPFANLIVY